MNTLIFLSLITSVFSSQTFEPGDSVKKNQVYHTMRSYNQVLKNEGFPGFGNFWFDVHLAMIKDSVTSYSLTGSLWDSTKKGGQTVDAEVMIGEIKMTKSKDPLNFDYHYDEFGPVNNLYGRKIQFRVNVLTNPVFSVSDSVYIPQKINLKFPGYVSLLKSEKNKILEATDLSAGQTIYWNADHLNQIGVCLLIEYSSNVLGYDETENKKPVINWILLEDTGSYKLDPSLFDGIPNKTAIRLTITRGNYLILQNSSQMGRDIKLTGSSRLQCLFRYRK